MPERGGAIDTCFDGCYVPHTVRGFTLIIECAHCHAKYQYDEERFERKPSKKIRCAKCREVFEIHNPAFAEQPVPTANPADSTISARVNVKERWSAAAASPATELPESTDERRVGSDEAKLPDGKRLSLAIIDGPDAGHVFRIEKPRVVIGRSSADLVLNDTESSRAHAAVEIHNDTAFLSDLGSKNGTFFGEAKIDEPVEIWNQSEFRVGLSTLMLIVTEEG